MDYWDELELKIWPSFEVLKSFTKEASRFWFFTTKVEKLFWEVQFKPGDYLVFGRETKGLPFSLIEEHIESCVRIPMVSKARSLNLATSVGIGLYGALNSLK